MNHYVINEGNWDSTIVDEVARRLTLGEVGILPTDTVYGIMCTFDSTIGKELIYRIKNRDREKKFQVLITSISDLDLLNIPSTVAIRSIAENFWPGPVTAVVPDKSSEFVGVRMPDHRFVRQIIEKTGKPLLSTSANRSGCSPITSVRRIQSDWFDVLPHFVVDGGEITGRSSTVVQIDQDDIKLLRNGPITLDEIKDSIGRDDEIKTVKSKQCPNPSSFG